MSNIALQGIRTNCLEIECTAIGFDYLSGTYTSKLVRRDGVIRAQTPFDINARAVIAFREIGNGHTSVKTLFGYMNCVPPWHMPHLVI